MSRVGIYALNYLIIHLIIYLTCFWSFLQKNLLTNYVLPHIYICIYERGAKVKCLKAAVTAWECSVRSGCCGREAPAASEASHASEARHARSEATRFVIANCT